MSGQSDRFVVVTTDAERRGVFGGFLESYDPKTQIAILTHARMAVYWDVRTHGVLGLASHGPGEGCRISPPVPRVELNGITAVMDISPTAQAAWEAEPWG